MFRASCSIEELGGIFVECVVTDSEGDGFLEAGDRIDIFARNGMSLNDWIYMTIIGIYSPSSTLAFSESFLSGIMLVSECTLATDDLSVAVAFNPIHNGTGYYYELMDVTWNDVVITIGYGETQVEWNPDISYLDGGEPASWISNGTQCGNLTLVCRVVDLQGNGLVNTGTPSRSL